MGDDNHDIQLIQDMESIKDRLEALRGACLTNGYDGRQLAIAITELEGAQLRFANSRPFFA